MRTLLLIGVVGVMACGPAAAPQTTGAGAAPPPAAGAATSAPVAVATQAPAAAQGPTFLDLAKAKKAASYKVTYRVSGTTGGQTVSSDQTWYVKPPKSRFDIYAGADVVSTYVLEDGTYFCSRAGGQTVCLKMPASQALGQNVGAQADQQVTGQPDAFDPNYQGTRQIAGQTGQCYVVRPKTAQAGFAESAFCYTAQGVPLFIQAKGQGFESTLEATAFSTSVSDDDFKLPAPARSLP